MDATQSLGDRPIAHQRGFNDNVNNVVGEVGEEGMINGGTHFQEI